MKLWMWIGVLGAGAAAIEVGGLAAAGEPAAQVSPVAAAERFAGTYRYVGGQEEIRRLDEAIEAVVSRMNFFIRGIARGRIREPNLPSETITIRVESGRITIARPGRPAVSAAADGRDTEWVSPDGDRFVVNHLVEGDALVQRFRGGSGVSVNHMRLGAGGRLVIETAITNKHLPGPLSFKTTYKRP